jgi:peptidoglycan/xylan/chitin deacetylase (PgdA/CDA1 family)
VKAHLRICLTALVLSGCQTVPELPSSQQFRFLLTFDDGPSIRKTDNPTLEILEQLAHNNVQPGIKGIFFVQTRNRNGGGTPEGREVMRRIDAEGHLLGLHSGDPRGHVGHLRLTSERLNQTLIDGAEDIRSVTGRSPELVRPPGLAYNDETLALYQANGMRMLLSDVNARDGVIHIFNISFRRRSHLYAALRAMRASAIRGELPQIDDAVPIIVTFHDPNPFTARHFGEYLHILTEGAARAGLTLAAKPFYDTPVALKKTALLRAIAPVPTRIVASQPDGAHARPEALPGLAAEE